MPRWKCILGYDGSRLHGWQVQPGLPTVQQHLADAILHITSESTLPQGSGRTDAGVHALAQVATFDLHSPIPAPNLLRALNRILPPSIRIHSLDLVPDSFHARHSARSKTYEYRIFPRRPAPDSHAISAADTSTPILHPPDRICSPMLAPFVWDCPLALDIDRLNQAAVHILGTHDFTSFAAAGSDALNPARQLFTPADPLPDYPTTPPTPCRTILHAAWHRTPSALTCATDDPLPDGLVIFRVTGTGFLHHMVRNLVGTFAQVGSGRLTPSAIPGILAARDRRAAGPTAPARGLFLREVHYA